MFVFFIQSLHSSGRIYRISRVHSFVGWVCLGRPLSAPRRTGDRCEGKEADHQREGTRTDHQGHGLQPAEAGSGHLELLFDQIPLGASKRSLLTDHFIHNSQWMSWTSSVVRVGDIREPRLTEHQYHVPDRSLPDLPWLFDVSLDSLDALTDNPRKLRHKKR